MLRGVGPDTNKAVPMHFGSLSSCAKSKNDANKATHYVNLGKKMRKISRRNYRIISSRLIIKASTIILAMWAKFNDTDAELWQILYAFRIVEK